MTSKLIIISLTAILPAAIVVLLLALLIHFIKNRSEIVLYDRGLKEFNNRDYDEARELFIKALKKNPNYTPALHKLGLVYFKAYDFLAAKKCFEKILENNPDDFNEYYNLALSLQMLKQTDAAVKYYNKAIEENDKDFDTYYNLGILYFDEKQYEQAITNFKKALALCPEKSSVMLSIAKCKDEMTDYSNSEDRQTVIDSYLKIADVGDELPQEYYISIATAYAKMGDTSKAMEFCRKSIEHNADNIENYKLAGLIYLVRDEVESAKANFNIALELEPGNPEVCKMLKYACK